MKIIKKYFLNLVYLLVCINIFSTNIISATPMNQSDLNALGEWTNWVAAQCNSSGATSSVPAGSGAPNGTTFPNLDPTSMGNAINKWIADHNSSSLLKDTGQKIVASAQHSNVSPFLIVSIAYQESGLANPSDFNVSHGSNAFGRSAGAGQPSFQGARSWYYWSSVPASVDYTAPENQNIPGGGDMATYLRNQYGQQIDANSGFYNIIILYAPNSDGNDPTGYAKGINDHVQQMIDLTNGTASSPSNDTSTGSASAAGACSCSGSTTSSTTVVLDPGHSGIDKSIIDTQTGLIDHDYPNFPEITQVFTIAQDLQRQLTTAGYKVVMTKQNVMDYVSLRSRSDIANQANAAIAVSIHDDGGQAYSSFQQIFDQRVGEYRTNPQGKTTAFTDQAIADKSASFAQIFQQTREASQGIKPDIVENSYSNRPGLSPGNLALVQLFSKVPWIYNETGSLNITDAQLAAYEKGILDGIKKSVPINPQSSQSSSGGCGGVSCSSTSTDTSLSQVRQNVVCLAIQELNTWKSQPGYPWHGNNTYAESGYLKYSQNRREQWCADFASWLYDQSKYPLRPGSAWNIAYVPNIQAVGQENKNFHWHPESGYTPKPGDLAIHGAGHVNVVEKVSGSSVTYIGGDQGNPDYPGGSVVSEGTVSGFHSDGITGFVSPD